MKTLRKTKILFLVLIVLLLVVILIIVRKCDFTPTEVEIQEVNPEPTSIQTVNLIVRFDDQASTYGDPLKEFSWTIEGELKVGDKVEVTPDEYDFHDAGEYLIAGKVEIISKLNVKYDITIIEGTYTINKRVISVIADNQESTYAQELKELTYSVTNAIERDNLEIGISTEAKGKGIGTYPITLTVADNLNYIVQIQNGKYTILPEPIEIIVDNKESVEGEKLLKLTGRIKGNVLPNDDLGVIYSKAKGNTPGKYQITAKISNPNYILVKVVNGDYIIKAKLNPSPSPSPSPSAVISDDSDWEDDNLKPKPTPESTFIPEPVPTSEPIPVPGNPVDNPNDSDDPEDPGITPGDPDDPVDPENPDDPGVTPGEPGEPGEDEDPNDPGVTPGEPTSSDEPDAPDESGTTP